MSLAKDVYDAISILERGAESVRAVSAGEANRFTSALEDLQRLAEGEAMPIAIVGGLGAIRYGYPAATQDIDVVIGKEHLGEIVRLAPAYGFKVVWRAETGWHTLTHGDVEINVVPEGALAKKTAPTSIPGPTQLGVPQGLGYASLAGWLELKLSSGRQKDRAHVVEVLKVSTADVIAQARDAINEVHKQYLELFDLLLQQAQEERAQERARE